MKWFFILLTFLSSTAHALVLDTDKLHGQWSGIEVIGTDRRTADKIRALLPIKVGSDVLYDDTLFKQWCIPIERSFQDKDIACYFVMFSGQGEGLRNYFVVEVFDNKKITYRTLNHARHVTPVEKKLLKSLRQAYEPYEKVLSSLFEAGVDPGAYYSRGIHYKNRSAEVMSKKLYPLVQKNKAVILSILLEAIDNKDRDFAARMLGWLDDKTILSFVVKNHLILDPSSGTRNEVARFVAENIQNMQDPAAARILVNDLCVQLCMPDHLDRNKAMWVIGDLDTQYLKELPGLCVTQLQYLAGASIIPEIKRDAESILHKLEKKTVLYEDERVNTKGGFMDKSNNQDVMEEQPRIMARQLGREITESDLTGISGGGMPGECYATNDRPEGDVRCTFYPKA